MFMVVLAAVVFVEAASSLLPMPKPKEAVALFRSPSRSFRDAFAFLRKSMAKTVDMEEMMFLQVGRSTLLYFTSLVPVSLHCAPTMDCKLAPKGSMQALARTHKLQHVRETCKCRALLHLIGFKDIETGRSRTVKSTPITHQDWDDGLGILRICWFGAKKSCCGLHQRNFTINLALRHVR